MNCLITVRVSNIGSFSISMVVGGRVYPYTRSLVCTCSELIRVRLKSST